NKDLSSFLEGENEIYKDPDHEYILLDDSDVQSEASIATNTTVKSETSTTTTNTTNTSNLFGNDKRNFTFTETVTNFIKAYTNLKSNSNDHLDEVNIDWLDSEIDSVLEVESTNSQLENEQELDIEINNYSSSQVNKSKVVNKSKTTITDTDTEQLSHMLLKIALRLQKVNLNELDNNKQLSIMIEKQPEQFGKAMGHLIWKSKVDIKKNIDYLENPASLQEYRNNFPLTIRYFFDGMLDYIQNKKWTIPGDNPNNNEHIHNAACMYIDDVSINITKNIDLVADEAIFRRLVSLKETHPEFRLLLGGWHTSKCMSITLIAIFSGYGIFNLAAILGVRYFDKFEKVVDYQATSRIIILIWTGVGIALQKYISNYNKTMHDIMTGNNNIVKVWYLFFCWAGYWVGHKMGIRHGNWNMQIENLKAFTPLFAVAASVNITRPGHYLAFDEVLERLEEKLFVREDRNLKSRRLSLWELSNILFDAFTASNPTKHKLFRGTSQNYKEGFSRLFTYYEIGRNRIYEIYRQDIEKSETRITVGRRARNIIISSASKQKIKVPIKEMTERPIKRQKTLNNAEYKDDLMLEYPDDYVTECPIQ
ncbi:4954_t:CDS:2, partial [Ambispora gerdemannii]